MTVNEYRSSYQLWNPLCQDFHTRDSSCRFVVALRRDSFKKRLDNSEQI